MNTGGNSFGWKESISLLFLSLADYYSVMSILFAQKMSVSDVEQGFLDDLWVPRT